MKQIRIVTSDRPGLLAEITDAMASAGVNIEDLAAESTGNLAVIEMTVDRYDEALRVLARTPFRAITEDILILKLLDKPGALAEIARRFKDARINLRSARTIYRVAGDCVVAIDAERTDEAKALVRDVLIS
jgi:histidine decarboxylase